MEEYVVLDHLENVNAVKKTGLIPIWPGTAIDR
jgi:hypothetical protein